MLVRLAHDLTSPSPLLRAALLSDSVSVCVFCAWLGSWRRGVDVQLEGPFRDRGAERLVRRREREQERFLKLGRRALLPSNLSESTSSLRSSQGLPVSAREYMSEAGERRGARCARAQTGPPSSCSLYPGPLPSRQSALPFCAPVRPLHARQTSHQAPPGAEPSSRVKELDPQLFCATRP